MATDSEPELLSVRVITKSFDWFGSNWVRLLFVSLIGAVLYFGIYTVKIGETAAMRRFGELVDAHIKPGLHFRIPGLVHKVDRVQSERIYRLEVVGQISQQYPTLTGDSNLVMTSLVVQYRIRDLKQFLFENENSVEVMRELVRASLVDSISTMFVDLALTTDKAHIEQQVLKSVQWDVNRIGLGLELVTVNLPVIEPPPDAMPAFRAVSDERARKIETINTAKQRSDTLLALARGEAANIVERARAQAEDRTTMASSEAKRFDHILAEKQKQPEQTRMTAYWSMAQRLLSKAKIVVLAPGQNPKLSVNLLQDSKKKSATNKRPRGRFQRIPSTFEELIDQHTTSASAHSQKENEDRRIGTGTHENATEAHHMESTSQAPQQLPAHKVEAPPSKASSSGGAAVPKETSETPRKSSTQPSVGPATPTPTAK